jgi:hypothetical protein
MAGAQQFSAAERERIKYHLGYPSLAAFANIQLGFVAVSQPLFLVEKSMDNLLDAAVPIVREHVARLDAINTQLDDARGRMRAAEVGEIKLQEEETMMLRREYAMWARSMADVLGCPINSYSTKFDDGTGMMPITSPVIH